MIKEKNRCLNFIKGVAMMLIVVLHGEFPTYIGSIINMFARWGVPVFFMTSGFFLYKEGENHYSEDKFKKKIIRILKYVIIYFILNIAYQLIKDTLLYDFSTSVKNILSLINPKNIIDTVLFNRTIIGVGGWFLTGMLLAYIVLYFINKKDVFDKAYYAIIPLLSMQFILAYIPHFLGNEIAVWYYRNTWFLALPCMLLGHYIHKNEEKIRKIYPDKWWIVILLLSLGIGVSSFERIFIGGFSIYIGTIILALTVFGYAVKHPEKYYVSAIEWMGEKITLYMFMVHPFIIENTKRLAENMGIYNNLSIQFMLPVLNIIITIIISMVVYKYVRRMTDDKRW